MGSFELENKPVEAENFVIAIGASAGGMEAIHTLFDHTPTDAVSYVIIQHLSPDHKSFMKELLEKHSKLKIFEIVENMEIVPNTVYVMPKGKNMTISKGHFKLKDRPPATANSAIDIFFNSLAADYGNRSVAIVLSGNGQDGTKGIAAIKKAGGMVIIQDPVSTEFKSMPDHAIESGNYDYILTPQLIPQKIIDYIKQRVLENDFSRLKANKDESQWSGVIDIIKESTPLDFSDYKYPTLIRRITRRMVANEIYNLEEYINFLRGNKLEIEVLSKEFMISVTTFFRDADAFEILRTQVIPEIIENKLLTDTLKIWCVGCATGEEAYSMAIIINEYLVENGKTLEVKIFATDIDKEALAIASKGVYSASKLSNVSEQYLNLYFNKDGKNYKVNDDLRHMIIFATHDIVHQPPYGKIDFICCRNLLIYLNTTLQRRIFNTLHFCLNRGGFLFLGPSEGLGTVKQYFLEVNEKWKIYKNLESSHILKIGEYTPMKIDFKGKGIKSTNSKSSNNQTTKDMDQVLSKSHLEISGYTAGVSLDHNYQIIQPFGDYENFLKSKLFTYDLMEILPKELGMQVSISLQECKETNKIIKVKNIVYKDKENLCTVSILVNKIQSEDFAASLGYNLYFKNENTTLLNKLQIEDYNATMLNKVYEDNMVGELKEIKLRLQEAYAELDSYKDNLQSYNEELISGNEEMQSANEELQSVNEELNTVNSEYQAKIKDLAELNDDFNNYFRSTTNSQLYVDKNLIIRKYSPSTFKQINIRSEDIGRSVGDLTTNLKDCILVDDIKYVINNNLYKEKQVQTTDGMWYLLDIIPYWRSKDKKMDGVIITFNDISEIKKAKEIIELSNARLRKSNMDHDNFIYNVSHDLKTPVNNVEGLIALLEHSNDLIEIKELMIPIIQSVKILKGTITELSEITDSEKGTETLENINLYELIEEIKVNLQQLITDTKAIINVDLEVSTLKFSKKNLRSILFNLLSNALKYKADDNQLLITITCKQDAEYAILCMQDTGRGIDKKGLNKLFLKFQRVHDLEANIEGSGIGLFLVKRIIDNAGGKIEVESKEGNGSCFKVYFKN